MTRVRHQSYTGRGDNFKVYNFTVFTIYQCFTSFLVYLMHHFYPGLFPLTFVTCRQQLWCNKSEIMIQDNTHLPCMYSRCFDSALIHKKIQTPSAIITQLFRQLNVHRLKKIRLEENSIISHNMPKILHLLVWSITSHFCGIIFS